MYSALSNAHRLAQLADSYRYASLLLDTDKYRHKGLYVYDETKLARDWHTLNLHAIGEVGNRKNFDHIGFVLRLAKKLGILDCFCKPSSTTNTSC